MQMPEPRAMRRRDHRLPRRHYCTTTSEDPNELSDDVEFVHRVGAKPQW